MALVIGDRVLETTSTSGTGTYSLGGAVSGFRRFRQVAANGDTVYYVVTGGASWEVGIGTLTTGSTDTLARTTVLSSSAGSSAINWPASGTRNIFCSLPASKTLYKDASGNIEHNGWVLLNNSNAQLILQGSGPTDNDRVWRVIANGGVFFIQARTLDNSTGTTAMNITRNGSSIDTISFPNGVVQIAAADINSGVIDGTVIGGVTPAAASVTILNIAAVTPLIRLNETDWTSPTDERYWDITTSSGDLFIQTRNTALSAATTAISITRSGTNIGTITLNGTVAINIANITNLSSSSINLTGGTISGVAISGGSVTGITDLAIADGGTAASTALAAFNNLKQAATDSFTGVVELATSAETITGTDTARVVTPAGLQAKTATTTASGIVELATTAEAIAGTDAVRAVTPAALASALGVFNQPTGTPTGQTFTGFTESTWTSIGPTGSGMTNIWSALDAVPTGVDWIVVSLELQATIAGGTPNDLEFVSVYSRAQGQTHGTTGHCIARAGGTVNSSGIGSGVTCVKTIIRVNSTNNSFEIQWEGSDTMIPVVGIMYLEGYGHNGV